MKTFIFALVCLTAVFTVSTLCSLKISSIANELIDLEKQFPDKEDGESPPDTSLERSEELLKNNYFLMSSACNFKQVQEILSSFKKLYSIYLHGSRADYLSARETYFQTLKTLKAADGISFISII